jgi:tetratricopeptide (TPR) repeat protein
MQATMYGGAAFQYINYGNNYAKRAGGWSLEILKLGVAGIKGRDDFNNTTGDIGYGETGFGFGQGFRGVGVPELSMGWKVKMLKRSLGPSSDQLIGADFGAQYGALFHDRLTLGAVVQNAFKMKKGDTDDALQPLLRLGAAYRVAGPLMLALDVSSDKEFRIGTEYTLGFVSLRAGMQNMGFSFGTGFLFRQSFSLDFALVQNPTLGMNQRVSLGYKFGAKKKTVTKNLEFVAKEHYDNAMGELDKHNYLAASKSLDMAINLDARLGENGWKTKAKRLRALVNQLELGDHPEYLQAFSQPTAQANQAHNAVLAFLDRDDALAVLLGHAAAGIDPKEQSFISLLEAMCSLTRREMRREDMLPTDSLVERRLIILAKSLYQRDYDAAIRAGKEAVMLNPNHGLAWTRLGSAYFASGNKMEAAAAWRKALDLDPSNAQLRKFMAAQGMQ